MLTLWQKKFQKSFAAYPNLLSQLTRQEQANLSSLLTTLDAHDVLNEDVLTDVLYWSTIYLTELVYLIEKLAELHGLNPTSLAYLFKHSTLPELQESLRELNHHLPLTPEIIQCLFATPYLCSSAQFMIRTLNAKVDIEFTLRFLSQHVDLNGLRHAIVLFDRSKFPYHQDHMDAFQIVASILANPLSQTIFEARLRHFSDYSEPSDPLSLKDAAKIISQLVALKNQED